MVKPEKFVLKKFHAFIGFILVQICHDFLFVILQYSAKILELARKQRMNTDIRRNIFCVLMSSEDYLDAFEKLLRFV